MKYNDLREFYEQAPLPKCIYKVFRERVVMLWWEWQDALVPRKDMKKPYFEDENWRVCTVCKQYKTWDNFWKNAQKQNWYSGRCKECTAIKQQQYQEKYLSKRRKKDKTEKKDKKPVITVTWDETCSPEILDIICKIWLVPNRNEEWEIEE